MAAHRDAWDELYDLELDIQEWLQTLQKHGKRSSLAIYDDFGTKRIIKLVEELFREFESNLGLARGNREDKIFFQKARARYLRAFREMKRRLRYE